MLSSNDHMIILGPPGGQELGGETMDVKAAKKLPRPLTPGSTITVCSVVRKKSQRTKKCKVKGKSNISGTQVLDRTWLSLTKMVHCMQPKNDKVIHPRL